MEVQLGLGHRGQVDADAPARRVTSLWHAGTVPYSAAVDARPRPILAVAWLVVAVLIALGGAGIVARADNLAGDATRPELTWRYDQILAPGLGQAATEARAVSDATDKLADSARAALVHLLDGNTTEVGNDLSRGDLWLAEIATRTAKIDTIVAGLPYLDSPQLLSAGARQKIASFHAIVDATKALPERWTQLELGTVPAVDVTLVMQQHDSTAFEASQSGVKEDYAGAITILDAAMKKLDQVAALRDKLAPVVDTVTLSRWIDVNRVHDQALRDLYAALLATKGRVTDAVRQALARYDDAKAQLPPDTRALVVILGDIALGGVNQAAIAVETVRGTVASAVAALD
jgi:hypothetical protein